MQFSTATLFAFSAAISQALAKVILTNTDWSTVTEGEPFTIKWSDADGPVTLLLKSGPSTDLATITTIASGQTGTSFSWTPSGLPSGTYAVEIDDSSDVNYGSQFTYQSTVAATTTAASSTTESSSTTSASSTSSDDSTSSTTGSSSTTTDSSSTTLTTAAATTTNATSTASSTASGTRTTSDSSTATNTPLSTNDSQKMGSPLALVFLTVAALVLSH